MNQAEVSDNRELSNKTYSIFNTDFYQLSMMFGYIMSDKANEICGFEAFTRKINNKVTSSKGYVFGGRDEIEAFIDAVKNELNDVFLTALAIFIVRQTSDIKNLSQLFKKLVDFQISKSIDFTYTVMPDGCVVKPYVPVFQFRGPRWIGQLIETPILNILNASISQASQKSKPFDIYKYQETLVKKSKEIRESTSKVLLEAGFRRAPGFPHALVASRVAIGSRWDGTSNVAAAQAGLVPYNVVGGTMAHAFIMSFCQGLDNSEAERKAFEVWNNVFSNTTYLVDTFDIKQAIHSIKDLGIKPRDIRIDSDPLIDNAFEARELLDKLGMQDVGIFLSGDLDAQKLKEIEDKKVPCTKVMVGAKYVNPEGFDTQEAGFVYKLVQNEFGDGKVSFPEKKSSNKSNYPSIKSVSYSLETDSILVRKFNTNIKYGFDDSLRDAKLDSVVKFVGF